MTAGINRLNISMGIQLASKWIQKTQSNLKISMNDEYNTFVDEKFIKAINNCVCLGRFQKLEHDKTMFYFDGAHTMESIQICIDWFKDQVRKELVLSQK